MEGIIQYLSENNQTAALIGTDIKDRGYKNNIVNSLQYNLDFFNVVRRLNIINIDTFLTRDKLSIKVSVFRG